MHRTERPSPKDLANPNQVVATVGTAVLLVLLVTILGRLAPDRAGT